MLNMYRYLGFEKKDSMFFISAYQVSVQRETILKKPPAMPLSLQEIQDAQK